MAKRAPSGSSASWEFHVFLFVFGMVFWTSCIAAVVPVFRGLCTLFDSYAAADALKIPWELHIDTIVLF